MIRLLYILALSALFLHSCGTSTPDNLLDEETYLKVFVEFTLLSQYDSLLLEETTQRELQEKVLEAYGITYEDFRVSHEFYEKSLKDQVERTDRASQMLRAERDSIHFYENDYRNQKRLQELAEQEQEEANQAPDN